MTQDSESVVVPREAQDRRRTALIERLGTIADLACTTPLPGELGDVAYDLLRQAAAQIASDRLHIRRLLAAAPSTSVREEAITAAIAKADEDFGYRFNLTRLVDGEETHTLFMDGFEPVEFDDRDDGYRLIAERRNKARATAVLAALVPSTDEGKRHG